MVSASYKCRPSSNIFFCHSDSLGRVVANTQIMCTLDSRHCGRQNVRQFNLYLFDVAGFRLLSIGFVNAYRSYTNNHSNTNKKRGVVWLDAEEHVRNCGSGSSTPIVRHFFTGRSQRGKGAEKQPLGTTPDRVARRWPTQCEILLYYHARYAVVNIEVSARPN